MSMNSSVLDSCSPGHARFPEMFDHISFYLISERCSTQAGCIRVYHKSIKLSTLTLKTFESDDTLEVIVIISLGAIFLLLEILIIYNFDNSEKSLIPILPTLNIMKIIYLY